MPARQTEYLKGQRVVEGEAGKEDKWKEIVKQGRGACALGLDG